MSPKPILSIIVPTLNRADTLRHTLTTIAKQDVEEVEVIVSDNHSLDGSVDVARQFCADDTRFSVVRPPSRLSMSKHWEFALSQASGGYITFLGDDDGVMPSGLQRSLRLLEEHDWPQALNSVNCEYHWPTSPIKHHSNILKVPEASDACRVNASAALTALTRCKKLYTELPMLYRGWVKRELLQWIGRKTEGLFKSCIPDVYAAIAVTASINEYWFTSEPLFIEGISRHSNGALGSFGPRETDDSFFSDDTIPFHASLTYCPATAFLVAESLLQAHDANLITPAFLMRGKRMLADTLEFSRSYSRDRYEQCLSSARAFAELNNNLRAFEHFILKFPYAATEAVPLPPLSAWVDSRYGKYPALAIRTQLADCCNIQDAFNLLSAGNAASVAQMNLFKAIAKSFSAEAASSARQISELEASIAGIQSSWSWRVTAPLRGVYNLLMSSGN